MGSQTSSFRNLGWPVNSRPLHHPPGDPQNRRDLAHRRFPVGLRCYSGEPIGPTLGRGSANRALSLSADSESLRPGLKSLAEAEPRAYLPAPEEPCPMPGSGGIVELKDFSNDNQTGTSWWGIRPTVPRKTSLQFRRRRASQCLSAYAAGSATYPGVQR